MHAFDGYWIIFILVVLRFQCHQYCFQYIPDRCINYNYSWLGHDFDQKLQYCTIHQAHNFCLVVHARK